MKRYFRIVFAVGSVFVLAACDGSSDQPEQAPAPEITPNTQNLADQCYLGEVQACDGYKAETGEDLPYAESARRKAAKSKTQGVAF